MEILQKQGRKVERGEREKERERERERMIHIWEEGTYRLTLYMQLELSFVSRCKLTEHFSTHETCTV